MAQMPNILEFILEKVLYFQDGNRLFQEDINPVYRDGSRLGLKARDRYLTLLAQCEVCLQRRRAEKLRQSSKVNTVTDER